MKTQTVLLFSAVIAIAAINSGAGFEISDLASLIPAKGQAGGKAPDIQKFIQGAIKKLSGKGGDSKLAEKLKKFAQAHKTDTPDKIIKGITEIFGGKDGKGLKDPKHILEKAASIFGGKGKTV